MKSTHRMQQRQKMPKKIKKFAIVDHFTKVQSKHLYYQLTYKQHSKRSMRNIKPSFKTIITLSPDRHAHLPITLKHHHLKKLKMNCLTQSMKTIKIMVMTVIHKRLMTVRFRRKITTIAAQHLFSLIGDHLMLKIMPLEVNNLKKQKAVTNSLHQTSLNQSNTKTTMMKMKKNHIKMVDETICNKNEPKTHLFSFYSI